MNKSSLDKIKNNLKVSSVGLCLLLNSLSSLPAQNRIEIDKSQVIQSTEKNIKIKLHNEAKTGHLYHSYEKSRYALYNFIAPNNTDFFDTELFKHEDLFPDIFDENILPLESLMEYESNEKDKFMQGIYTGMWFGRDVFKANGIPDTKFVQAEHTYCQSWFGDLLDNIDSFAARSVNIKSYMKSDLHTLRVTYSRANNLRSNNPYGQVQEIVWEKGNCRLGDSIEGEKVFEVLEPTKIKDDYRGDVARGVFYFIIRYAPEKRNALENGMEKLLKEWNKADPVDEREVNRNNKVQEIQGNRNPFVDTSAYVNKIKDF